jgi:hypothetical protein
LDNRTARTLRGVCEGVQNRNRPASVVDILEHKSNFVADHLALLLNPLLLLKSALLGGCLYGE